MTGWKSFTAKEAKEIGERLGIKWDEFEVEQFRMEMNVELEHGKRDEHTNVTNDDALVTGKIALAHLNEFPDYYDRLDKLEKKQKHSGKKGISLGPFSTHSHSEMTLFHSFPQAGPAIYSVISTLHSSVKIRNRS